MKVKLIYQTYLGSLGHVKEGEVVDLPDSLALDLILVNKAEPFVDAPAAEDKKKGAK